MVSDEVIKLREEKEKKRLYKIKGKHRYSFYLVVLFVIIVLVDVLDNITTNTNGNITSCFINEFFVRGMGLTYEEGYSTHNMFFIITYAFGLITPFYKALGDKWGRKPLFAISTLGMASGLLIVFFCTNYVSFLIGNCVTTFFLGHDIQILYVLEEAPSKHRAKMYSIIKGLGGLGSLFIPLLRETVMHNNELEWRNVFIIPGLAGIVLVLFVIVFVKESKVYVDKKIEYLETPIEIRRENEKKEKEVKTGLIPAVKYVFKNKELRMLLIIKCIFDVAILAVQSYESILAKFEYTTEEISKAEYFYPIFYCASVLISGFLADRIGRKKTILAFGIICFFAFISFVTLSYIHLNNPYIIGVMYGLYLGGYWIGRDYMEIMSTEMVPTKIRASIIGAFGLLVHMGMIVGLILNSVLPLFMPIWLSSLIIISPSVLISIILLILKVKETKGVDYEQISFVEEE